MCRKNLYLIFHILSIFQKLITSFVFCTNCLQLKQDVYNSIIMRPKITIIRHLKVYIYTNIFIFNHDVYKNPYYAAFFQLSLLLLLPLLPLLLFLLLLHSFTTLHCLTFSTLSILPISFTSSTSSTSSTSTTFFYIIVLFILFYHFYFFFIVLLLLPLFL